MAHAERLDTAGAGTDLTSLPTARVLALVKSGGDDTAAASSPSVAAIDVSCRLDIERSRRPDARQACHRAHTPCQEGVWRMALTAGDGTEAPTFIVTSKQDGQTLSGR